MAQDKQQTGQHRCKGCGRAFSSDYELREHEKSCKSAQPGAQTTSR